MKTYIQVFHVMHQVIKLCTLWSAVALTTPIPHPAPTHLHPLPTHVNFWIKKIVHDGLLEKALPVEGSPPPYDLSFIRNVKEVPMPSYWQRNTQRDNKHVGIILPILGYRGLGIKSSSCAAWWQVRTGYVSPGADWTDLDGSCLLNHGVL